MRAIHWLLVSVVAIVGLAFACTEGRGQERPGDHGFQHRENHDWYRDLRQPGTGYSCCNGRADGVEGDCRPTRAYLQDDGTWRAMVDGHWVDVPPKVVLKQMAPDGHAHVCANRAGLIYCFLAGSPKS